ncbi:hypothetical protein MMC28_007134 [Mycoblastus sanguinarius]|nr:hypothetical protein [Mycoblastus sanguinarius]
MVPPLSANVSAEMLSLQRRQDNINNTVEAVGAPPLPPNFVIEIGWARPLPPGPLVDPVCSENTDNANNTDGCAVTSANASVLIGNATNAGLLPVAIDSFSDS